MAVPFLTSRDDRKRLDSQKVALGLLSYVRGFSTFAGTLRALGGAGAIYLLSDDHFPMYQVNNFANPKSSAIYQYASARPVKVRNVIRLWVSWPNYPVLGYNPVLRRPNSLPMQRAFISTLQSFLN